MNICEHCGQQVPENARFCTRCGAPMPYNTQAPPPPTWQERQAPPPPPQHYAQGGPPPTYPPGQGPGYQQPWQPGQPPYTPPPQGGYTGPITSKWAWGMAFAPVLVGLLIALLDMSAWIIMAYVYFTLVTLLMLDISALMRGGVKAGSWMWLGILVPPIYLHMRAQKTDRQYGYFYLQIGMLLVGLVLFMLL